MEWETDLFRVTCFRTVIDFERFDLTHQGRTRYAQRFGGAGIIAVQLRQNLLDMVGFNVLEGHDAGFGIRWSGRAESSTTGL